MPQYRITRTHRGGPDLVIVDSRPAPLLELAPPPKPATTWRDPPPQRPTARRSWLARLFGRGAA